MRFLLWLALAITPLAATAQDAPTREVHVLSVFSLNEEPVFQIDGQTQSDKAQLLAGGTLVVQALDSLRVLVLAADDGLAPATDGANGRLVSPGFDIRALRARPTRNPSDPRGSTLHTVIVLACVEVQDTGECLSWKPAHPYPSDGDGSTLLLEIVDGASRALFPTGSVRPDDD